MKINLLHFKKKVGTVLAYFPGRKRWSEIDKAKPVVRRGRKATGLWIWVVLGGSRVAESIG